MVMRFSPNSRNVLVMEDSIYEIERIKDLVSDLELSLFLKEYRNGFVLDYMNSDLEYCAMILDNQVPIYEEERKIDRNGGVYVLNQLSRRFKDDLNFEVIAMNSSDEKIEEKVSRFGVECLEKGNISQLQRFIESCRRI